MSTLWETSRRGGAPSTVTLRGGPNFSDLELINTVFTRVLRDTLSISRKIFSSPCLPSRRWLSSSDRRPRAPSLAAQRSHRGTNAPTTAVVRRASRPSRPRGRVPVTSASRLQRTRARNPVRRGSTRGTATHRGSSAARPGRHPRTPGLDAGRPRAIGPHARDVTDRFPSATVSSVSSPPRPNLLIITSSPRRRKRKPDPRCARSPRCSFPSPCTPRFRCACSRPCARSPASPAGAPPRASGCSG